MSTAMREVDDPVSAGPLTIGAVSAVLRDILANGLIRYSTITRIGDVTVTVLSPERITIGAEEPNQINLFLYRVGPHSRLPQLRSTTPSPLASAQPRKSLPLDLHYLVTAYGAHDFHTEILLGCVVSLFNGIPVLTADAMNTLLKRSVTGRKNGATSPARDALAKVQMPPGAKRLDIRQEFLSFDDMSKLWSVLQARYRPSVAYQVSAIDMPSEEIEP